MKTCRKLFRQRHQLNKQDREYSIPAPVRTRFSLPPSVPVLNSAKKSKPEGPREEKGKGRSGKVGEREREPEKALFFLLPLPPLEFRLLSLCPPRPVSPVFERGKRRRRRGGMGRDERFPVWEAALGAGVAAAFAAGLVGVYLSMPDSDYSFLKLPRNLEELQILTGHLENYTSDYTLQVLVGYCAVYIFMQTFMIPGTIFMSLLAGALFGQLRGLALVVFAATAGASSCYFLSKMIGKPLVFTLWPDKLSFFQRQVAKRREKLLNYILFLRVTPTLPNTFINLASPIVDVPYHTFLLGTLIGLIPAAYVTVRAGIALGELTSLSDLYDTQSIALLFLIGVVSVTPALLGKDEAQEKPSATAVGAS